MSSPFIERSKHAAMTAAVESHFGSSGHATAPGAASGNGFAPGGTDAWNGGQPDPLQDRGGYNYSPKADIGHTVDDQAFSGVADGLPGTGKKLWRK
jgi:hypothetical protein